MNALARRIARIEAERGLSEEPVIIIQRTASLKRFSGNEANVTVVDELPRNAAESPSHSDSRDAP